MGHNQKVDRHGDLPCHSSHIPGALAQVVPELVEARGLLTIACGRQGRARRVRRTATTLSLGSRIRILIMKLVGVKG
jgi:hypothetical protein